MIRTQRERDNEQAAYLAKDNVLVVQPIARVARDEKLAAVRARPAVCHREQARPGVLQVEILIVKLLAV